MAGKRAPIFKITSAAETKERGICHPHPLAPITEKSRLLAVPGPLRQRQLTINGVPIILTQKKMKIIQAEWLKKVLPLPGCVHLWRLAAVFRTLWISSLCVQVLGTFLTLQLYIFICAYAFMNCEARKKPVRIHVCGRRGKWFRACLTEVEVEAQQMKEQQEGDDAQYDCDEG